MTTPRRWLRFALSLRTLFVLVTVLFCWLGWQALIIQNRTQVAEKIESKGGRVYWISTPLGFRGGAIGYGDVPWGKSVRELMGDVNPRGIELPEDYPAQDVAEAQRAFPHTFMWTPLDQQRHTQHSPAFQSDQP